MYTEQPYLQTYRVSQQNCSASSVRILYQEFAIHFTEIIFCPRRSTTTRTSREIHIELNELYTLKYVNVEGITLCFPGGRRQNVLSKGGN